jgi:hypothetical protein
MLLHEDVVHNDIVVRLELLDSFATILPVDDLVRDDQAYVIYWNGDLTYALSSVYSSVVEYFRIVILLGPLARYEDCTTQSIPC